MKFLPQKVNYIVVLQKALSVGFWLLIAYEGYSLYSLYAALKVEQTQSVAKRSVRVDFKSMDQAIAHYKGSQTYSPTASADLLSTQKINDPFAHNVAFPPK